MASGKADRLEKREGGQPAARSEPFPSCLPVPYLLKFMQFRE